MYQALALYPLMASSNHKLKSSTCRGIRRNSNHTCRGQQYVYNAAIPGGQWHQWAWWALNAQTVVLIKACLRGYTPLIGMTKYVFAATSYTVFLRNAFTAAFVEKNRIFNDGKNLRIFPRIVHFEKFNG